MSYFYALPFKKFLENSLKLTPIIGLDQFRNPKEPHPMLELPLDSSSGLVD
jgi:hypothetical protein